MHDFLKYNYFYYYILNIFVSTDYLLRSSSAGPALRMPKGNKCCARNNVRCVLTRASKMSRSMHPHLWQSWILWYSVASVLLVGAIEIDHRQMKIRTVLYHPYRLIWKITQWELMFYKIKKKNITFNTTSYYLKFTN